MCLLANIKNIQLSHSGNSVIKNLKNYAMKEVIRQIVDFYKRAGIPVVAQGIIVYRLKELHKKYDKLRKNAKRLNESPSFLDETMPFWPKIHEKYLTKQLKSKFLSNLERSSI